MLGTRFVLGVGKEDESKREGSRLPRFMLGAPGDESRKEGSRLEDESKKEGSRLPRVMLGSPDTHDTVTLGCAVAGAQQEPTHNTTPGEAETAETALDPDAYHIQVGT